MTTFEEIKRLALERDIEVKLIPGFPTFCRLIMPTRKSPWWCQFKMRDDKPVRMMPPLLFDTAKRMLRGEEGY